MRILKDVVGDVSKDGVVIHSGVRVMVNDSGRLAVFEGKSKNPPVAVYDSTDVTYRITGSCSACKGFPARMTMMRVWDQTERTARAS